MPNARAFIAAGVAAWLALPNPARAQEGSPERVLGCYLTGAAEGWNLLIGATRPPGLFRLDLLRDVRTGAEFTRVAVAHSDAGLPDGRWALAGTDTVTVEWSNNFWGVRLRFPAAQHVVAGEATSWSDAVGGEPRFSVTVVPADCAAADWVEGPLRAFPHQAASPMRFTALLAPQDR